VVIHGKVYDLTSFLPEHPGGKKVILNYAGKDATPGFEPIHPPGAKLCFFSERLLWRKQNEEE
jgi:cytochrome b involved in lipid metabolism